MATTVNLNSAYEGDAVNKIFTQIFMQASTLEKRAIDVYPNVVGNTAFLQKTTLSDGLIDYTCAFTPSGTLDLDEKKVDIKTLQLPLEICKSVFLRRWNAAQMGFSAWNDEIPANEREALMLEIAGTISSSIEKYIWTGDATVNGQFGGILTELENDADANDVAGVAITAANVIAEMGKVLDATPVEVLQAPDFKFAVSTDVYRKYVRALGNANFAQNATDFEGFELTVLNGLPANSMLTYNRGNLVFLTGLEGDMNEIRILDMTAQDLSDNIRIKATFKAGATYVRSEDVTFYKVA